MQCSKEQRGKKQHSEANFTVEATVLIPIITAIILAIIQLCFVMHDRVVITEGIEHVLSREMEKNGQWEKDFQEIEQHLLISKLADTEVLSTKTELTVSAMMESRWIVPFFFRGGQGLSKEYHASRKFPYQREKTILSEIILDMIDRR